jgi:hypothetical protein
MSDLGRAALVSIDLANPSERGALWQDFAEQPDDEPYQHPIAKAWALWESIKDDWPTMHAAVIANDRAARLQAAYRISAMLGGDYETELARLETEALAKATP